ncbi:MAG: ABC transporter permease [Actinomycetota bacterium]|nr:ABC transporter permease [Actinomycetota bacterium]
MTAVAVLLRRINLRHLSRKKLRTALTVAGIAAGVALMFSISVINATLLSSFRSSIRDLAGAAELEVAATDTAGLPETFVERVSGIPGVEGAVPVVRTTTEIRGPRGAERALVLGITPDFTSLFPQDAGPLAKVKVSGGFGAEGEGLLVARSLAAKIGLAPGSRPTVETPSGVERVEVSGEISGGAVAFLNAGDLGLMLLPAAQETFDRQGRVDSIYVVVSPGADLAAVDAAIEAELAGAGLVGPPGERGQGLERVFSSLATLLSMGGTVALFVALFVVYNTMSMSLAERRREISMTIALGAHRRHVFGAFLAEAVVLGTTASVLGVVGGRWLASFLVERAADDFLILSLRAAGPVVVQGSALAAAALGGVAVSLAGAYIPARRVLAVAPIESLRPVASYEWDPHSTRFGSRVTLGAGVVGIIFSVLMLVAFLQHPEQKWIVTLGLLFGLTGVTFLLPHIVPFAIAVLRPLLVISFGTIGRLASDALAKNPRRSTFTVAALVLTLGLVVGVAGALGSYERQIENTATALIGAPIYVTSKSFTGLTSDQPLRADLRDDLASAAGVRYVYPIRFALLDLGAEQGLVYALPVEQALREGATTELSSITQDPEAFLSGLADGGITISRLAAERLGVGAGDTLALPTPSGEQSFEVAAVFDDLLSFNSFYLDLATYQRLWKDDKADEFGVLLEPGASVAQVKRDLQGVVADAGAPASVFEKDELVGRILEVVGGTFQLAKGVQLAALVVAAVTIANTMFTAVLERRWEMGLERAIGMGSSQLGGTVLLEAGSIGLIGGVGGVLLGTITAFFMTQAMEAEFSWVIAFQVPVVLILVALIGSVALAAAAGVVPSRIAVRTPIIESLRYE